MKYIVTDLGPIDGHQPGTDVTNIYPADVRDRLIAEGYVAEDKPKAKGKKKTAPDVADEQPAEDEG